MEYISNCCGASITQADPQGHGKCGECGENCVPAIEETETEEIGKVTLFELYLANQADSYLSHFTSALMLAYQYADLENKAALNKAFPDYFVKKYHYS